MKEILKDMQLATTFSLALLFQKMTILTLNLFIQCILAAQALQLPPQLYTEHHYKGQ
jgi:hypothetical protein